MRYWEVIKELTEDPTKKFEAKLKSGRTAYMSVDTGLSKYFKFKICNHKGLIEQSHDGGGFNENVALELDWKPVKQLVTWQEAIEARADGKRVWCEFNDKSWGVAELVANHLYFRTALDDGKWYMEG